MNSTALRSPQSWRGYATVWAILGVGLVVSVLAAAWLREEARRTDETRFAGLVEQTRQNFDNITEKYQQALQRLADAIGARENFTERHWDLQMHWLTPDIDFPGLVEIQLVRVAPATNLPPELEESTGDDYLSSDVEQRSRLKQAAVFMAQTPFRLEPIWNFIPRDATQPHGQGTPGDSLASELLHIKSAAGNQALRTTGRRVVLRNKKTRQEFYGTTLLLPIPDETLAQGWSTNITKFLRAGQAAKYESVKAFVGRRYTRAILCGSIDWQTLIHSLLSNQRPQLHLDLYASPALDIAHWLGGSGTAPLSLEAAKRAGFHKHHRVNMYMVKWTLAMHTTPAFDDQSTHYRAYVALFGGMVVTVLMAALLAVQVRGRVRQQSIAGELRESLAALEAARAEREALGRDLHDGAIQSLYALQLGLSRATEQVHAVVPEVAERLADYRRSVSAIIGELRGFILCREPEASSGANLGRVLTASLNRLRPSTSAELGAELDADAAARLNGEQAVHLANIAREALSNSLRHASASHIKVALGSENGTVRLEISDDGCGFDPTHLPQASMGLANMSVRAREAGGELKVDTAPGHGTRVVVRVAARESAVTEAATRKAGA